MAWIAAGSRLARASRLPERVTGVTRCRRRPQEAGGHAHHHPQEADEREGMPQRAAECR
ncbi:MAG: hypothetical protein MJY80_05015 [Bacteroidales bacterium]|nr:hypothetical protein [Bacteroidales bacterium]